MKVISIVQPWATLIAVGEKQFETRSWRTKHRGELAIHASKTVNKSICRQEPFRSILAKHGYTGGNLPSGAIIAVTRLAGCFKVTDNSDASAVLDDGRIVQGNEFLFGGYSEGRFAWQLSDVQALGEYIPAKGRLGLWEHHGPERGP